MAHYLAITTSFDESDAHNAVQVELNKLKDWVRFHGRFYIAYTNLTSSQLYEKIKPLIPGDATILIMRASPDVEHRGWLQKLPREWLGESRSDEDQGI